jgi:outer membrane receptor protein involved in Fe transport
MLPVALMAQLKVSGKTIDSAKKTVGHVTLAVSLNERNITSAVSDEQGAFTLHLPDAKETKYILHATHIGFKEKLVLITIPAGKKEISMGNIALASETKELAAVNITGKQDIYEQKADRFIFNVEKSMEANGSNGWDAIAKTPGIQTTGNNIRIIGKSGMTVMVNDRKIQLSGDELFAYLSAIPSENITAIEVIANPGARYDASGNSGIINIKLKKNKNEGLVLIGTGSYEQRKNGSYSSNLSYNYRKKWLTLYGFINLGERTTLPVEYQNIYYPTSVWASENAKRVTRNYSSFQMGADFALSSKDVLGVLAEQTLTSKTKENNYAYTHIKDAAGYKTDSAIETRNNIYRNNNYTNIDINYRHTIDEKGSYVTLTGDYLQYTTDLDQSLGAYTYAPPANQRDFNTLSYSAQRITNYTARFDYEKHLGKTFYFNTGLRTSFTTTDNNFRFYKSFNADPLLEDFTQSNHFNYQENVQAAYISANKTGKRINIIAGLRAEYTDITGELVNQHVTNKQYYLKLFPSLNYQHKLDKNSKLTFTYGRRINRPSFTDLNPFKYYVNQYNYSEGNPRLTPSYSDNAEITYTYKEKYSIAAYALITSNFFQQIPFIDTANNTAYFTRQNIGRIDAYGIHTHAPFTITPAWSINTTLYLFYYGMKLPYLNEMLDYGQLTFYGYLTNQFVLSKKRSLTAELNLNYQSHSQLFLYQYQPNGYVDAGIKWGFAKKQATLGLNVYDIFKTNPQQQVVNFASQHYTFKNAWESRYLRLTFSYKFGKQTVKDRKASKTGNAEEFNRANN